MDKDSKKDDLSKPRPSRTQEPEENIPSGTQEPKENIPSGSQEPKENIPSGTQKPKENIPSGTQEPEENRQTGTQEPEENRKTGKKEPEENGPSGTKKKKETGEEEEKEEEEEIEEESEVEEHHEELDVLEVLERVLYHVGDMGRYQIILFLCTLPVGFFYAFILFVQMFIAVTPQFFWCKVPELSHLDMELRRTLSAPGAATGGTWDMCSTYDTDWSQVLATMTPPHPSTPTIPCQHGWEFEFEDIPYETVVTERGWVCDSAGYVPAAQGMFFFGAFVGGLVFGWLADHVGRVPAFMAANLTACVGGIGTIFTSHFLDFGICRFIVGLAFDSNFMLLYILVLEYVGVRHRTWVANMSISLFFGGGCVLLPWLALGASDWRLLLWLTSLPMLLVVAAPWVIPESTRWLVNCGDVKRAVTILRKFERINRSKIPDEVVEEFIEAAGVTKKSDENIVKLLKSPLLRNTMFVLMFMFVTISIAFDGIVRMSDNLGLDFFITFTLTSATEIPSSIVLIFFLDRLGRRNFSVFPLLMAGLLMLIAVLVPKGIPQTGLAIVARFFINMGACAVTQWCTELLPTGIRALGSSIIHVAGFLATVMSPFIVYSSRLWVNLPLLTLGLTAISSGCASIIPPETAGCAMPQTIADGEIIVLENSLFPRKRTGPYRRGKASLRSQLQLGSASRMFRKS